MIEVAVILSAVVRHWADFAIILVLLVANAVVGFWEEYQAAERHRGAEGQAGVAGQGPARRQVDNRPRPANWCPAM